MPEYLAPGVYVEETSFRAKSIEGVSTTTTGFIGPTRYGPIDVEPELVDDARLQRLADGRGAARDVDAVCAGSLTGLGVGGVEAIGDEVKRRPALHLDRRVSVMG